MNLIKVYLSHIFMVAIYGAYLTTIIFILHGTRLLELSLMSRTEPIDIYLSLTLASHIPRFLNLKFRIKISFEILELFKKMTIGQLLE